MFLKKIKTEKKWKNENYYKIRELEIELVKIKYSSNPNKLQSELEESNKIHVFDRNLHGIENEILLDYVREIEMVGNLKLVIKFVKLILDLEMLLNTEYETYINAIDQEYESEDAFFNGSFYKINTPQFNLVDRNQYGNGCDFKHEIIEHRGNNCFIPTKGYCFIKFISFLTGQNYKQQYFDFIRNEKRRSNIMTKARIQPFCRANNINLGYSDGTKVFPRSVTERKKCFVFIQQSFFFNMEV